MTTTYLAYIPSPSQGVWHLGPVPLRAYAFFIIVGIIVALVIGDRRWEARGGERGVIYDIAIPAVLFGLIGGRLYHVITDWRTYFGEDGAGLGGAFRIWDGGLGIWGAVALGGVGAWIGCRHKGIPLPAFGDAIAPGIVLAQAIGRLGNYFNQELYGRPTTLPWGLEIYERRDAAGALDTLNGSSTGQLIEVVHPTFLYELLWNLLLFAVLIYIDRRFKIGHGRLFAMYVAGYCLGRFWIELMRSDVATHIAGIRVNSFTSTFVFIGAVVYIMVAPKGREDPASLAGKPEKAGEVEDTVETFAKQLTAVAATTGVVAAAKAADDANDEDAAVTAEDQEPDIAEATDEPEAEDAEALGADVAGVPAESVEDAEEFAVEGEEEPQTGLGEVEGEEAVEALEAAPEAHEAAVAAADEAQAVADEVAAAAEEPEPEAEEPEAESAEQPEVETSEPEAGLGEVEGEEAVEALEAAPEAHEAAVAAADEAQAVADEVAAAAEEPEPEAEEPEAESAEQPEVETSEPEAGLGEVEGEEAFAADETEAVADELAAAAEEPLSEAAAEAEALAEDVAEAPSEVIAEAQEFAEAGEAAEQAEAAAQSDASEPDEPETEAAEAAVEEAESEPSEEEAAEEAEAVVEEADAAAEDEPKTGVLEETKVDAIADEPPPAADKSRGRLSRWLRRNR